MTQQQSSTALKDLLFAASATVFAILDGASIPGLPQILEEAGIEHFCLCRGGLHNGMAEVAPYLVILEEGGEFTEWVLAEGWGRHWGIFGTAEAELAILDDHFRSFLSVYDDMLKPVYFRYYDPRVWRAFLPTCTPQQLKTIWGPVTSFVVEDPDPGLARIYALLESGLQVASCSVS